MRNKREYNTKNQDNYFYSPFSENRRNLRAEWNTNFCKKIDWESFLYDSEKALKN